MSEQEDTVEKANYGVAMITPGPQSVALDSNLVAKLFEDIILLRKDNMKLVALISDLASRVDKLAQRNVDDPVAPMNSDMDFIPKMVISPVEEESSIAGSKVNSVVSNAHFHQVPYAEYKGQQPVSTAARSKTSDVILNNLRSILSDNNKYPKLIPITNHDIDSLLPNVLIGRINGLGRTLSLIISEVGRVGLLALLLGYIYRIQIQILILAKSCTISCLVSPLMKTILP